MDAIHTKVDEHFMSDNSRVAVCYWRGEIDEITDKIIKHNAHYFDKLYLITDKDYTVENVHVLEDNLWDNLNIIINDYRVVNKVKTIGPGAVSDILFYFPKRILSRLYGLDYKNVIYFDTNTVIWNQFLINELTLYKNPKLYYKDSLGVYCRYNYLPYASSDFSMDTKTNSEDDFLEAWIISKNLEDLDNCRYTFFGPNMMYGNDFKNLSIVEKLPIISNELDPQLIYPGSIEVFHKSKSIGLSLSFSQYPTAGYKLTNFEITNRNSCILSFERM